MPEDNKNEMEQEPQIETKKQKNRRYRGYLKAKFNEKVGYVFIGSWHFLKRRRKALKKPLGYVALFIGVMTLAIAIVNFSRIGGINEQTDTVKAEVEEVAGPLADVNDELDAQNARLSEYEIAATREYVIAYDNLTDLFMSMYSYEDGEEYVTQRAEAVDIFSDPEAEYVTRLYGSGLDSAGNNMIDTMGMSSDFNGMRLYTASVAEQTEGSVEFYAIVDYSGQTGVSEESAANRHQAVYRIDYNLDENKVADMTVVNTMNRAG